MERPRALSHPAWALGQEHPLVTAQGPRAPDRPPTRDAARGQPGQSAPLPRLPAARRAPAALPPARPHARASTPRCLAGLGRPLSAAAVRPARADPARAPRRHPRRDPPRTLQRPTRGPQLQDPPDQPPRLRLPLRRPAHRARLPLLLRPHNRAAAMNFTHNSTGAPNKSIAARTGQSKQLALQMTGEGGALLAKSIREARRLA